MNNSNVVSVDSLEYDRLAHRIRLDKIDRPIACEASSEMVAIAATKAPNNHFDHNVRRFKTTDSVYGATTLVQSETEAETAGISILTTLVHFFF